MTAVMTPDSAIFCRRKASKGATIAESTVIMAEDTTRNIKKIVSVSKISENPKPETESKINEQEIIALFKKELSSFASDKQKILNIIKNSKTRSQINNKLTKAFSNNTGKIMKALKPYIKNLPGK